jgi:hypothetical protein
MLEEEARGISDDGCKGGDARASRKVATVIGDVFEDDCSLATPPSVAVIRGRTKDYPR